MARPTEHPLARTAARADTAHDWLTVRHAPGGGQGGWTACSQVDAAYVARWEGLAGAGTAADYGRTHPMAQAGYVLGWYAGVAAGLGALFFALDRRVPRLGRADVGFRTHAGQHYPDAVATLQQRFWCLPGDPDAGHPDAEAVADEGALAAVLRAQVRAHADDFLAGYRPGARLPRRTLLGAFFDGLDGGFWLEGPAAPVPGDAAVAAARLVLPGGTAQFADASSFHTVTDRRGRAHLSRRRVSCCYYFKVSDDGAACTTCPRTTDTERAERLCANTDAQEAGAA